MPIIARKPYILAIRCDQADPSACSYVNLPAKVYRVDSVDSFSYTEGKSARASEFRRAHDYV